MSRTAPSSTVPSVTGTCALDGCETSLDGLAPGARYCSPAHRTAGWKARTGYTDARQRTASRNARKDRPRRIDVRVSVRKVLALLEDELGPKTFARVHTRVVSLLTDRQREALDG